VRLPLFFMDLEIQENNKNIYDLENLFYNKKKWDIQEKNSATMQKFLNYWSKLSVIATHEKNKYFIPLKITKAIDDNIYSPKRDQAMMVLVLKCLKSFQRMLFILRTYIMLIYSWNMF